MNGRSSFANGSVQHAVKVNMVKRAIIDGEDANIGLFVDARRKLLELRGAKRIALQIADLQFPKTPIQEERSTILWR